MASVLDIVRGISTVMANTHDGALDENGDPIKVGLNREEGDPILDSRVMDGFKVQFMGPVLRIKYSSELPLKEVHKTNKFEGEIEATINDVASFIKKEYKKLTGSSLTLTAEGEPSILVQNMSRIRTWVQSHRDYKIGGMKDVLEVTSPSEDRLDDAVRDWLGMNANKAKLSKATGTGWFGNDRFPSSKDPENVKGKRDEEPRES